MWWALHDPAVTPEIERAGVALAPTPILLIHSSDDRTVDVGAITRWAETFPNAQQRVTETGGHQFLIRSGAGPLVTWLEARLSP